MEDTSDSTLESDSDLTSTDVSSDLTSTTQSSISKSEKTVRRSDDSFEFLNPSPQLHAKGKRRQPYGPNRDSMGNYIGPGGDRGKNSENKPIDGKPNLQSNQSSEYVEKTGNDGLAEAAEEEYTIQVKRGRHSAFVKRVVTTQVHRLQPHICKGVKRLRSEKNELFLKLKPHLQDAKSAGQQIAETAKDKGTKVGVNLALRGIRYITRRSGVLSQTDLTEEADSDPDVPEEDPFDFDLNRMKVQPVNIPKLVITTELPDSGNSKNHAYFEGLKQARYDAVIDQARSRHTKAIAEKLKKHEVKLKAPKQVSQSIGPRIHVAFKCDTEKQLLNIRIIEATGLPGKDSNGLSDPYCIAKLKPDADIAPLTTRIIGKTVNPKWKEVFELSGVPALPILARQVLHVAVYDYDQIGADDLVGYVDIGFATHDLPGGVDMWFDLRTKENEEQFRMRGHVLVGLRYDERREQLTVFVERCHDLERIGWLMLKGTLHINGLLVKEEKAKIERITTVNPELKRRMVFTKIKPSLLEEYTVAVYMAFRRYFAYYKFFGQINLSSKSKVKEEEAIWAEAIKLPGEAAFKQLTIQPFVGVVKKPWTPANEEAVQDIGYLHVDLKTSDMGTEGMILTCTLNKADELRLPRGQVIFAELYLVKDHLLVSKENTLTKCVGQRITPLEEQFEYPVETEDIHHVELMIVLFRKSGCGKTPFGYLNFSRNHGKSVVEEMDLWQTVIKTSGHAVGKRLHIRRLLPEITLCTLLTTDEIKIPLREPSLLPGRVQLGEVYFSIKYDENKEQLSVFIEMVNGLFMTGKFFMEGYLWDLGKNIRKRKRSAKMKPDGYLLPFKETLRFKNLHSSFYDSHHLCLRLMKKRHFQTSCPVGQAVIKIQKSV